MPVTKKKGAIFAIYTDSPTQVKTSSSVGNTNEYNNTTSTTNTTTTPRSPTKKSVRSNNTASTTATAATSRKALIALQPMSVKGRGFPSASTSSKLQPSKPTVNSHNDEKWSESNVSVNPKAGVSRTSSTRRAAPPTKSAPTKRQLEIFCSPALPSTAVSTTTATITHPNSPARRNETPSKRGRTTPFRAKIDTAVDKENVPPSDQGSPATRTRSKVRYTHTSISSLSSVLSPARTRRTPKSQVEDLVGDGRGTLTLKKGRALAWILGAASTKALSPTSPRKGKTTLSRKFGVQADDPLADVSDAYGATGEEPEGFRTAGL